MIAGVLGLLVFEAPRTSAAPALALPHSDYPHGAHVSVVPATNNQVDQYLQPAHRSTFERLGRLDGAGWLQFATWHFKTGRGGARETHSTVFGYGISVFRNAKSANRALADIRLKTNHFRVAHLPALRFQISDVHQTLVFSFFTYRSIEVEAYYEYSGVAPARVSRMLSHDFSRQRSHLAHLARVLTRRIQATATATAVPTDTSTPTPTDTPTAVPPATATSVPTATVTPLPTSTTQPPSTATPTSTATPSPTPSAVPVTLTVTATMEQLRYAPGKMATIDVQVTANAAPLAGATVQGTFFYPDATRQCESITDALGNATCAAVVPSEPDGTHADVDITVYSGSQIATARATFMVHS